jgi:hypothetical protein
MGFALWIDEPGGLAWAQGTHEYRPMGTAVIGYCGQFRHRDFNPTLRRPRELGSRFAGFFGSLEEINATIGAEPRWNLRPTPGHLL